MEVESQDAIKAAALFGSLEEWLQQNNLQQALPKLEQVGVTDVHGCLQLNQQEQENLPLTLVKSRRLQSAIEEAKEKFMAQQALLA